MPVTRQQALQQLEPTEVTIDRETCNNRSEQSEPESEPESTNMATELNASIQELIGVMKEKSNTEPNNTKKNSVFKPEKISGHDDINLWISRFRSWTKIAGIATDAEAIFDALKLLVPDTDVNWLENLEFTNESDLYEQVTEHFNNKTPIWLLEQTLWGRAMTNSENLEDYIKDIEKICTRLQKSEREKMTAFVRGLPPNIRIHVVQNNPQTWEETTKRARLAQEASSLENTRQSPKDLESIVNVQTKCIEELTKAVGALQAQSTVCPIGEPPSRDAHVRCQLCFKKGHSARECRNNNRKQVPTDVQCFYCRKTGHIKRQCRKFREDTAKLNE